MSMREEFEAWSANHDYLGGIDLHKAVSGDYADMDLQHAWESWQASRQNIVIELPKDHDIQVYSESGITILDSGYSHIQLVRAIEAAGVKVKP